MDCGCCVRREAAAIRATASAVANRGGYVETVDGMRSSWKRGAEAGARCGGLMRVLGAGLETGPETGLAGDWVVRAVVRRRRGRPPSG
ncbi:hypothetical protein GCM10018775_08090 [Streptomyces umbrinus]|nr:hypothetical protein GCM10018775_08090 [Streptomyces umbrinus]